MNAYLSGRNAGEIYMKGCPLKKVKTHELGERLLGTLLILAVYMTGRSILLYNVDSAAYQLEELNSQNIMISMISGDRYQYTVFALGIMPYITSTLIMWIYTALRGSEFRAHSSPKKIERTSFLLMIVIATSYAVSRADGLIFKESDLPSETLRAIAVLEMIAGAVIIFKITRWGKDHAIGAHIPIILINILDNLSSTMRKFTWGDLQKMLFLCLIMAAVILVMENIIIRVPVQRVSIHNTYADKSYIAFKPNPIGVMPVMFAITFFMLPRLIVSLLLKLYENNNVLRSFYEKLNLTNITGVAVYLGIIFMLDVMFSFLMLMPGEMAKQLQRGGDSIVGVYAGKKTKRYLRKKVLLLSSFSGCVLCLMMGTSFGLALNGEVPSELAMLPTTAMILTGILCNLYREVITYWKFDSYSFFI